jgi:hypothetical protein
VKGGRSVRALVLPALFMFAGCASRPQERATDLPPESAQASYWLDQPPAAAVSHGDFGRLWKASRRAIVSRSFTVDRVDLRGGVMTTFPQVSRQFFEVWRNDVGTLPAALESSLSTVRRSVRIDIRRRDDGAYEAVPKVVVEKYAQSERRITSVARYAEVFALDPLQQGSRERDRFGADLPLAYWYALGRDTKLEEQIAADVKRDLRS